MNDSFKVVDEAPENQYFPIRPREIDTKKIVGFGKHEVEKAAERLISFFQNKGYWGSFTLEALFSFYQSKGWSINNAFFGLMGAWYDDGDFSNHWREASDVFLAMNPLEEYCVTDRFIERCNKAA